MIMEIVSFDRPEGFSNADLLEDARGTVDRWQGYPGLQRKHFVTDGPQVMGVYVWSDRAAAEKARDAAWIDAFVARTGVRPRISYFDIFMLIDNQVGAVFEYVSESAMDAAPHM